MQLSLWFLLGLAAAVLALAVAGALLVRTGGARARLCGRAWRYGVANLARRRAESIAQIVAFGLGIMLLLALAILRNDLVTDWRASLPADVPNYFFVNIPTDQRADFEHELAIAGRAADAHAADDPRPPGRHQRPAGQRACNFPESVAADFADREQNLTWSGELGDDNRIVAGHWWTPASTASRWCRWRWSTSSRWA